MNVTTKLNFSENHQGWACRNGLNTHPIRAENEKAYIPTTEKNIQSVKDHLSQTYTLTKTLCANK